MFALVNRRPLICLLAAAQLLLSVPVVNAMAAFADTAAAMPCAGDMPAADSGECPCCPDGVTNMASCLAACTASVSAMAPLAIAPVPAAAAAPPSIVAAISGTADDPPLKPPPIR
jgi:hypothetical protein